MTAPEIYDAKDVCQDFYWGQYRGPMKLVSADLFAVLEAEKAKAEAERDKLRRYFNMAIAQVSSAQTSEWNCAKSRDLAESLLREAVEALEGWAAIYDNCSISTGYCCCGDAMESHANPMDCGHSPVDQGWYAASQQIESARATLAKIKEAKNG